MRTSALTRTMLVIILASVVAPIDKALAVPSGFSGRTLLTSSLGCGDCHGSSANAAVVGTISGPSTLAPGQTGAYTITVTVGTSTSTKAGVDIAVSSGTLAPVSSQLSLSGGEITHNTRLVRGTAYSFNYTAPMSGGSVTIYATVAGDANTWNWASNVVVTLPVQLSSFMGVRTPSGTVRLDWRTMSEFNNYGFYVQRRSNTGGDFHDLVNSFIPGHGTTTLPQHYSYTDATVTSGAWRYRLKQVDLDGTIHYSDPVSVDLLTSVAQNSPLEFTLQQNYPNPFNPSTTIRYSLAQTSHVSLRVLDILGKEVASLVERVEEAGAKSVFFDASKWAGGTYFYRLRAGDFVQTRKLTLAR